MQNIIYFSRIGPVGYPTATYDLYDNEFHQFAASLVTPILNDLRTTNPKDYNSLSIAVYKTLVFNYISKSKTNEKEQMVALLKGDANSYHFDRQHAAIVGTTFLRILCGNCLDITAEEANKYIDLDEEYHKSWADVVDRNIGLHELAVIEEQDDKNHLFTIQRLFTKQGWDIRRKSLSDLYYTIAK